MRTLVVSTSIFALSFGMATLAEEVAELEEVVIGAGEEKVATDTPTGVSVEDQDDLDEKQPSTVEDIVTQAPGVQGIGSGSDLGQGFNIRGVGGSGSTVSGGAENSVIINVDGTQKSFDQYRLGGFFGDPEMYKRVEIFRGPAASTLYGSGAYGGVINFETKDADDFLTEGDNYLSVKTKYDTNGEGLTESLIYATRKGRATALLNLNKHDSDSFSDSNGEVIDGTQSHAISGIFKLGYDLTDDSQIELSYTNLTYDVDNQLYDQMTFSTAFGYVDRKVKDETFALTYQNEFSDNPLLDITAQFSYSDIENEQTNSTFATYGPGYFDRTYGYKNYNFKVDNNSEFTTGGIDHYVTAGLSYSSRERILLNGVSTSHPEGVEKRYGIYAQDEMKIGEKFMLVPGIRIDKFEQTPGDTVASDAAVEVSETSFSPKIIGMYSVNDHVNLFASASKTERQPTLDERYDTMGSIPSIDLEKEVSVNYEAGFSLSYDDIFTPEDALRFKLTAFQNNLDNMIVRRSPASTTLSTFYNVQEVEIQGFELEANYETNYAYLDMSYAHARAIDQSTDELVTSSPQDNLRLDVGAKIPKYDLRVGWEVNHFAHIDYGDDLEVDGYTLHGFSIAWAPDTGLFNGLEMRINAHNVFGESYQNALSSADGRDTNYSFTVGKSITW